MHVLVMGADDHPKIACGFSLCAAKKQGLMLWVPSQARRQVKRKTVCLACWKVVRDLAHD